jgi:hypothetical protein
LGRGLLLKVGIFSEPDHAVCPEFCFSIYPLSVFPQRGKVPPLLPPWVKVGKGVAFKKSVLQLRTLRMS